MPRVFVYGTLKRGFGNHRFLKNATFVGEAHTLGKYRMLDGRFPVLRDIDADAMQVSGEVYDVDEPTLDQLDDLESLDTGMYERAEVGVVLSGNREVRAYIYIGCGSYWDKQERVSYLNTDGHGHLNWIAPSMRPK